MHITDINFLIITPHNPNFTTAQSVNEAYVIKEGEGQLELLQITFYKHFVKDVILSIPLEVSCLKADQFIVVL